MSEAGDFVELLETYLYLENLNFSSSHRGTVTCNFRYSINGKLMTLPFFKQMFIINVDEYNTGTVHWFGSDRSQ